MIHPEALLHLFDAAWPVEQDGVSPIVSSVRARGNHDKTDIICVAVDVAGLPAEGGSTQDRNV